MIYWGCEFLDLEDYRSPDLIDNDVLRLPMEFIAKTIDPLYTEGLKKNNLLYIQELAADIREHGIRQPGTLYISPSKIKLQDGNHRYLAADILKLSLFPVVIKYTDGKLNAGLPLQGLIKELLCSENLKNVYSNFMIAL